MTRSLWRVWARVEAAGDCVPGTGRGRGGHGLWDGGKARHPIISLKSAAAASPASIIAAAASRKGASTSDAESGAEAGRPRHAWSAGAAHA